MHIPDGTLVLVLSPSCSFSQRSLSFYQDVVEQRNVKGLDVDVIVAVDTRVSKALQQQVPDDAEVVAE